jgi:nucleoside 2-deoxyribosyltransferase
MLNIYFAGPDVFNPNYPQIKNKIRRLCQLHSLNPLLPGDSELITANDIFKENIGLLDIADGVIVNLNPFRGRIEPDSGTAFEIGYAFQAGKFIIGFLSDHRDLIQKIKEISLVREITKARDQDNMFVEDFGYPVNLMLAQSTTSLLHSVEEAIRYVGINSRLKDI